MSAATASAETAEIPFHCQTVNEAFERALRGDGVGIVYPLGIDLATCQHMHDQAIGEFLEGTAQQQEANSIKYLLGLNPEIFEPLYSKCLVDNDALSKPVVAANVMYMMYPPGAALASHYDFVNGEMSGPDYSVEENLTIIYILAGTKRLSVFSEGAPSQTAGPQTHEVTQRADMLIVLRGGTFMDGAQVRHAVCHGVPELRKDEIASSVTFDLMPLREEGEQ